MTRTTEPVLLGLDASPNRVGWGLITEAGRPIGCGCLDVMLPRRSWRTLHVRDGLAEVLVRFLEAPEQVLAVYREAPWFPDSSGPKSATDAGRALGTVDAHVEVLTGRPVVELQPATWRSKAKVGRKGSATYEQVADAVDPPWPTREVCKPEVYLRALLLGFDPEGRQDAADAGCIAEAGRVAEADKVAAMARLRERQAGA